MDSPNIFSIDVEEWFHIAGLPVSAPTEAWPSLERTVEKNFRTLLDVLDGSGAKATCFTLGWVAERYPHLVRDAAARGHEIACHGYDHRLITTQTPAQFAEDIRRAKSVLEQAAGCRVAGYRAPSFSITDRTRWAFAELVKAGFEYDSSVFPTSRADGGMTGAPKQPHVVSTESGSLVEFPISVARLLGRDVCLFGGGYLRLFPWFLIRRMARQVNDEGRPVIYYIHPREMDPSHPRMAMPLFKRFKSYVNLKTVGPKLRSLVREQRLTTFRDWLATNRATVARVA